MSNENVVSKTAQQNALVLASVCNVVSSVICEVSGNEISNAIAGQSLTTDLVQILVCQEIVEALKD